MKTATVAKFTLHKIIQSLLEDLQQLESHGLEIDGQFVKGSLRYMCGDFFDR